MNLRTVTSIVTTQAGSPAIPGSCLEPGVSWDLRLGVESFYVDGKPEHFLGPGGSWNLRTGGSMSGTHSEH